MVEGIILHEPDEIRRRLRQQIDEQDITQKELAETIGLSPSQLSRYLTDERNTSYDKIYHLWTVLQQDADEKSVTATHLMNSDIAWASPDETVREVGQRAMTNSYTQIPVREGDEHIGWIGTEDLAGEDPNSSIRHLTHQQDFTTVPPYADRETIEEWLRGDIRAMLVAEEGKYLGIITSEDLVRYTVEE